MHKLLLADTLVNKINAADVEGQADRLCTAREVEVRQLVLGGRLVHVVLNHLGQIGNLLVVRSNVRELGKVVVRDAVDLARPQCKAAQVRNGQRLAHNEAGAVLGNGLVQALEPALR